MGLDPPGSVPLSASEQDPLVRLIPLHCFARPLKVEPDGRRDRARRNVVRPAEGGKEVVDGFFVGEIDNRQARAQLEFVAAQQVVLSNRDVEEIARGDAGRIMVVVLGAGCRN